MNKEEILYVTKRMFNFHPDEKFESLGEILKASGGIKSNIGIQMYAHLTSILARYIDELEEKE